MDRITEHHLRIIRVAIIGFAAVSIVSYCYMIGNDLYEMRQGGGNKTFSHLMFNERASLDLTSIVTKKHHLPYQTQALIVTSLIYVVLINIGLIVGIVKKCKFMMRLWIIHAIGLCFLGTYLMVLKTFGTYNPEYAAGVGLFFAVAAYANFIVLVYIFHEKGEELETVIRTHNLDDDRDDLIPDFGRN